MRQKAPRYFDWSKISSRKIVHTIVKIIYSWLRSGSKIKNIIK